jgi:DME family drug/metabolite transporter
MPWGAVLIAAAAVCWGVSGGIAALLMAEGWDPSLLALVRGAIGLCCVLLWLALRPRRSGLGNARLWLWSALAGLGVAGNFAFYFLSAAHGGLAVAVTLMYCAPVIVFLVSFALGLERATALKWAAIALVMLGIALLTGLLEQAPQEVSRLAVLSGLLAALSYALFIFGFKFAVPHGSPQAILSIAFAVLVAVLVWRLDGEQLRALVTGSRWPLFVLLGVVGAGLSFWLYVLGLRLATPTVAAVVAMLEPVTATLFGVLALEQSLRAEQVLGVGLILAAAATLAASAGAAGVGRAPRA